MRCEAFPWATRWSQLGQISWHRYSNFRLAAGLARPAAGVHIWCKQPSHQRFHTAPCMCERARVRTGAQAISSSRAAM